jgi:glycosyltransferase involved in cell wall biosynthesis
VTNRQRRFLRIAVLLPYEFDSAPSQRFRWEQWETYLRPHAVQVERVHFCTVKIGRYRREQRLGLLLLASTVRYIPWLVAVLSSVRVADIVVIHRNAAIAGPPLVEWLLKTFGSTLVYDFDDAIYLDPPGADSVFRRLFNAKTRVAAICRWSRLVGVGNRDLSEFATSANGVVRIWPTTIDSNAYSPRSREPQNLPVCIGWTGSQSTAHYLVDVLAQIAELQREIPFRFRVIGAVVDLASFDIAGDCIPWSPECEVEELQRFDIGLMPLTDSPWARGKCALKALQYQALGIPAVVSDVGMNREAVSHGVTGFLVSPGGDWKDPLRRLLLDPELLRLMGRAARSHVVKNFSAEAWAQTIASDLRFALLA